MLDTRLHNAAALYAQAYPSDPFAYNNMLRALKRGEFDREHIVTHAEAILAERRASVERRFKAWKKSPARKAMIAQMQGQAAA